MARFVAQLIDELAVLDRRRGERGDAGQTLEQVAVGSQPLGPLGDRHGQHAEERVARDDRHDRQRDDVEGDHQLRDEAIVGVAFEEQRLRVAEHAAAGAECPPARCETSSSCSAWSGTRAQRGRRLQTALGDVPQPHRHPVAVDDLRRGRGEALGDLEARAGLGERV